MFRREGVGGRAGGKRKVTFKGYDEVMKEYNLLSLPDSRHCIRPGSWLQALDLGEG